MDGMQISPTFSDLLIKSTFIRNEISGNTLQVEFQIPFPVVTDEYTDPTYLFWETVQTQC